MRLEEEAGEEGPERPRLMGWRSRCFPPTVRTVVVGVVGVVVAVVVPVV